MLIVTHATITNSAVLETRSLPRKFFGRVSVFPRGGSPGLWLRLIFEMQFLRYLLVLAPLMVVMLVFPDLALPLSQSPLLMLAVIIFVEMRVIRLSKAARAGVVAEDEAARRLDTLVFRARACLRKIAARHDLTEGELRLVVEQSELARIPPLTLVSVQTDRPKPQVMRLDAGDRQVLEGGLFDAGLTERGLHAVNQRDDTFIRDITQEARAVSAHSRLAAALEKRAVTA